MTDAGLFITWHVLLWAAAISYIAASIAYGVLAPWHRSHTGRRLMFAVSSTAVSLSLVALYTLHVYGNPRFLLVVIYGLFFASGLGLCLTFIRQQLRSRKVDSETSLRDADIPNEGD